MLMLPDDIFVKLNQRSFWRIDDNLTRCEVFRNFINDGAGEAVVIFHLTQHEDDIPVTIDHFKISFSQSYFCS